MSILLIALLTAVCGIGDALLSGQVLHWPAADQIVAGTVLLGTG